MMVEPRCVVIQPATRRHHRAPYVGLIIAANLLGADQSMDKRCDIAGWEPENHAPRSTAEIILRLGCCNVSVLRKQDVDISLELQAHILVEIAGYAPNRAVVDGIVAVSVYLCVGDQGAVSQEDVPPGRGIARRDLRSWFGRVQGAKSKGYQYHKC